MLKKSTLLIILSFLALTSCEASAINRPDIRIIHNERTNIKEYHYDDIDKREAGTYIMEEYVKSANEAVDLNTITDILDQYFSEGGEKIIESHPGTMECIPKEATKRRFFRDVNGKEFFAYFLDHKLYTIHKIKDGEEFINYDQDILDLIALAPTKEFRKEEIYKGNLNQEEKEYAKEIINTREYIEKEYCNRCYVIYHFNPIVFDDDLITKLNAYEFSIVDDKGKAYTLIYDKETKTYSNIERNKEEDI